MRAGRINIVGCGPGTPEYLTEAAIKAVAESDMVLGPSRLLALFDLLREKALLLETNTQKALMQIEENLDCSQLCVLVSGDPGCFSLSRLIISRFGLSTCRVVPGISSVQLAMARLGLDWAGANILSVHGRPPGAIVRKIAGPYPVVVLLGGSLDRLLSVPELISENKQIILMQNLGQEEEKISKIRTENDLLQNISASSLLVIYEDSAD